ncbi:hypothetical protein H7F36_15180 [Variovorax sp. PAMC28562]|uniref:hypothetical protein n=1 Tax=Variovorax sp. PAMC28562 TaxID=2762323 RepID=UPI00164DFC16|nr:hypothetical protein [Variovorax sp. PAMC28562]QNK72551.1 hypothetical protein H7F36_15180 [Variovorax sp. PAMC28562]
MPAFFSDASSECRRHAPFWRVNPSFGALDNLAATRLAFDNIGKMRSLIAQKE